MNIKLTLDSTCDLPPELLSRFDVAGVIPLGVIMGDNVRPDGSFDPLEIYEYADKTKKIPSTSAVNIHDFQEFFTKLTEDGSAVIHFSISGAISASCQNAETAAKDFENVYVVDGRQLSTGTSLLLACARDMLNENPELSPADLAKTLNAMADKVQASFCIDTIFYLYKNGRCSALSLLGANLLRLHPSIHLSEGVNKVGKKYRGRMANVISNYIADLRADNPNYDNTRCFITYSPGTPADVIAEAHVKTKELFDFKEILETTAGSTITCHCGKGTLGLLFMNK